MIIIMIDKLDNGRVSKTIVKTFEEVSYAKSVIGYHCCCFAEGSTSANLNWLSFCAIL
jgi:hypothetical protein